MTSTPPSFTLSIRDEDWNNKKSGPKRKCREYCVVALCPSLFCIILLSIGVSIFLTVKFKLFCHTPLGSVIYKNSC